VVQKLEIIMAPFDGSRGLGFGLTPSY